MTETHDYPVAFENIEFRTIVTAEKPIDAARQAVEAIPAHLSHKWHGGIEVLDPRYNYNAHWFEPRTKLVSADYGDESILEHKDYRQG